MALTKTPIAMIEATGTPSSSNFLRGDGSWSSSIPTSMVRVNTSAGYGSTNTKIRRYTNSVTNTGSDITSADSATLGATFTINTSGIYAISISDTFNSVAGYIGASLNSANLTTDIHTLPVGEILCVAECPVANGVTSCSWVGFLSAGSIIRSHGTGTAVGTTPNCVQFTITRVA